MNVSSVRLTVPKAAEGELMRKALVNAVLEDQRPLTYIHAGAGYGKPQCRASDPIALQRRIFV